MPVPRAILDAGCGDGRLTRSLAALFPSASVVAIDADAEAIDVNRHHAGSISWEVGEVGVMSLPAAHFDLVVCVDVLEHVLDDDAGLRWLAARLAPGGILVLHVPGSDQRHLPSIAQALRAEIDAGQGPHYREGYARADLSRRLQDSGLEVLGARSTFHSALVRTAVDLETWIYLRRARWLKALALPLLLAAGATERRTSADGFGNGCLAVARRRETTIRT